MATGKALDGKPCAGKLHARFEEGASAREEPRRKALLHRKKLPKNHVVFVAVAASLAMCATCAAELTHRWSFNGDYSDSVGGADAMKCGTYVSLYGGRVHMGYGACSHGTGYVDLGTNMLDTTAATIEIWARQDGVHEWSRVFDYGKDTTQFFCLSWSRNENINQDQVGARSSGGSWETNDSIAPYEIGTDYYIAVTFERQGDKTVAKWQRRDAATGELQKYGSLTMGTGIHTFENPVLYLGYSQHSNNEDALAAYDEVRVWRGVLTDAQLEASAAAGPDAAIAVAAEVPQFTPAEPPEPPAQRAAVPNGGFRMMTYNIQYCYDEASTIVPDRTAARIIAENPDFCCVNEVRDSAAHPEATMLAKLTGMHKTFGGNDSGSNGNLILSRERPISSETVFLKMAPSPVGWGDRYCVIAEFKDFCVAVTHLDTTNQGPSADVQASNAVAIATIRDAFAKYTKPVFLCGDWNTRPNWENMARFNEFLEILSPTNGVRTYHGHKATGGYIIDYIAVDTAHVDDFHLHSSYVIDDIITSDHNPVIAEVYRRPAASELGWVDESFLSTGSTGTWNDPLAWNSDSWKAELGGENAFTPNTRSGGTPVTVDVKVSFDVIPLEQDTPNAGAQGAVWIGTNGCFQVWTRLRQGYGGQAGNGWVDVVADGVTPTNGVEYTFRVTFDYKAQTYSVEVKSADEWQPLSTPNSSTPPLTTHDFPLATSATAISTIRFKGDGVFTSLTGEYVAVEGFSASETVLLKDNASVILDAAKAAWLNARGEYAAVSTRLANVTSNEFATAYLCNLDLMNAEASAELKITGITVAADNVEIAVTLERAGALAQSINGVVKFYGAATLAAFKSGTAAPLASKTLVDTDFSEGDTATATFEKNGNAFFGAKIGEAE